MKPIVLCYPACGTCKKAEKWMKDNLIEYSYRPIKEDNPTKEELTEWLEKSGISIHKFFNTSGLLYKQYDMKSIIKTASNDELLTILAESGLMVKRPILLSGDAVLVGFNQEEWNKLLL